MICLVFTGYDDCWNHILDLWNALHISMCDMASCYPKGEYFQDVIFSYLLVFLNTYVVGIGHFDNIPTTQFFTGISRNTPSKSYMLSLTECVWDFKNNARCGTH